MDTIFWIVMIVAVAVVWGKHLTEKNNLDKLRTIYPRAKIITSLNYYFIENNGMILASKTNVPYPERHIKIKKINDVKIYEDGKEASLGKTIIGGAAFGIIGALAGSSSRSTIVYNMGIKLYTDTGFYDINVIKSKTKKSGFEYKDAINILDQIYSIVISSKEFKNVCS